MENIKNNSIIFSTEQEKTEILNYLSNKSLFLNLKFYTYNTTLNTLNKEYYFYLLKHHNIKLDLAKRLVKYFAYLEDKTYKSEKINQLVTIRNDLIKAGILELEDINQLNNKFIISINNYPVPRLFKDVTNISLNNISTKQVKLFKTTDSLQSVYFTIEKVIELIKSGVSLDDIVILNSNKETDLNIEKIFGDANIPISFNNSTKLNTIPDVIKLIRILETKGFNDSKTFLTDLISKKSNQKYVRKLISIYNNYLDNDLSEHPEILANILNQESVTSETFSNCINLCKLDGFIYESNKHYILLNYTDSTLPLSENSTHYLNEYELEEIGYIQDYEKNEYLINYTINVLNKIDNLYLVSDLSEDNNLPILNLKREIKEINYEYKIKEVSYLDSINQLGFAKDLYDFNTYYLKNTNFERMYKKYNKRIINYPHTFTGIKQSDLNNLLAKNNTITPYKLENYNLCHFKYLLDNLLKLQPFETNINQFLGNLSHKVLEEYTKDKTVDIDTLIDNFEGFPEEISYKEHLYKQALKNEIKTLLNEVDELHDNTLFKNISTEVNFKQPFKLSEDFYLSGIIDKVMLYKLPNGLEYFVLIDYKLGNKDFDLKKYNKNIQLQLPMYLYAYKQNKDLLPLGFFYQTTSLGRFKLDNNAIKKNFSLKGAVLEDKDLLNKLNPDLTQLQGITPTNDGLRKSKRLFTEKSFEELSQNIENLILDMIQKIKIGDFEINPIKVNVSNKPSPSCEYCEHYSICYNKSGV